MKLRSKFNWIYIVLIVTFSASCDQEELEIPDAESFSKIYLRDALENPKDYSFAMKDQWYEIPLGVGYGGVTFPEQDISVNLKVNTDLVKEFNASNGTAYPAMPEGSYRLNSSTVVLPAGKSNSNSIRVAFNPLKLTGPRPHLLPITIAEVSGEVQVNQELRTVYYLVSGVYGENPYPKLSPVSWTVHGYSSDENDGVTTGGRARHAFDGSLATFWHSQWRRDADGNRPGHPHFLSIDMQERKLLHGLEIFGRTNKVGADGNPRDIVVELSSDGETWIKADSYVLGNTASNTIYFPTALEARYFKLTVNASHQDVYRTHLAEIQAF